MQISRRSPILTLSTLADPRAARDSCSGMRAPASERRAHMGMRLWDVDRIATTAVIGESECVSVPTVRKDDVAVTLSRTGRRGSAVRR